MNLDVILSHPGKLGNLVENGLRDAFPKKNVWTKIYDYIVARYTENSTQFTATQVQLISFPFSAIH